MPSLSLPLRIVFLLLLGALASGASAVEVHPAPASEQEVPIDYYRVHYDTALKLMDAGKYEEALLEFQRSFARDKRNPLPLLGAVEIDFRRGDLELAGKHLENIAQRYPDSADVQIFYGRYYYLTAQPQEAETALKRAIELEPGAFTPRVDLGELYLSAIKNAPGAAEAFRGALEIRPEHPGAHFGLGRALAAAGDSAGAERALREAARLRPDTPLTYQAIGELYTSQGRNDDALRAFAQALKVSPGYAPAHLARGAVFAAMNDQGAAIDEYWMAAEKAPTDSRALIRIAMLHQGAGRADDATRAYLDVLKRSPDSVVAYNNLAWLAAERGEDLDRALEWAQRAVELKPASVQLKDTLAWVHRARGEREQAVEILTEASRSPAAGATLHYHLGLLKNETGDAAGAGEAFRLALEKDPNFSDADKAREHIANLGGK